MLFSRSWPDFIIVNWRQIIFVLWIANRQFGKCRYFGLQLASRQSCAFWYTRMF